MSMRSPSIPTIDAPKRLERALWVVVVVTLVADIVTTWYGLQLGLTEANPIAESIVHDKGVLGMFVVKAMAIFVGISGWAILPRQYQWIVPACLSIPWAIAISINLIGICALSG